MSAMKRLLFSEQEMEMGQYDHARSDEVDSVEDGE